MLRLPLLLPPTPSRVVVVTRRALCSSSSSSSHGEDAKKSDKPLGPWERFLNWLEFRPGATGYANFANKAVAGKGFRFPSPGAPDRGEARVPVVESTDSIYNTNYYIRDTRRNQEPILVRGADETVVALPTELPPSIGSVGKTNPSVARYDPTGTRTAMTTSYKAMNAELAKHVPNHLPTSLWRKDEKAVNALVEEAKRKGIPVPIGSPLKWSTPEAEAAKLGRW